MLATPLPSVALVACVKTKLPHASAAQDLYTSSLFRFARQYAELVADRWFILSAKHGVLEPTEVIEPYEQTLKTMRKAERERWSHRVREQLSERLTTSSSVIFLAGQRYCEGIADALKEQGHTVEVPMLGLGLGIQMRWLKREIARINQQGG